MHAILSKSEVMAALFMEYSVGLRATDIQWGWTALHCAAHVGMVKVAESLLGKRASPYATSKVVKFFNLLASGTMQSTGGTG